MLCQGALIPLGIWNAVETNVGVVCACLPSMRPLLRLALGQRINKTPAEIAKSSRSVRGKYWPSTKKPLHDHTSFTRLRESDGPQGAGSYGQSMPVYAGTESEEIELQERQNTNDGIFVKRTTEWKRSART